MRNLIFTVFIFFLLSCSKEITTPPPPSPIPMDLNYYWEYYYRNPVDGRLRIDGKITIIDTLRYENQVYHKAQNVDNVLKMTTNEYWIWEPPVFRVYLRNMDNNLVLHEAFSTTLLDTIEYNGQKSVLVDTLASFENYKKCWKYEIHGMSDAMREMMKKHNIKLKDTGPKLHYIKPSVGFLSGAGGKFLGDFQLDL